MGRRRPRRLLWGLPVLVAVLLWHAELASSQSPPSPADRPQVVEGGVDPAGTSASGASGWRVTHPGRGVYRIVIPAEHVRLDVSAWDAIADVMVIPLGNGRNEVRFRHDGKQVDTGFLFTAIAWA